jgi:hypothetical protein
MKRFVSFVLLMSLAGAVSAEGLSYTYAELGYGRVNIDSPDVDGDGFGIGGSFALTDQFHLLGSYQTADFDFGVDYNELNLGVGFNTAMTDAIDVVASLSYVNVDVSASGFGSADDNGYSVGVGLRGLVSPQVELFGGLEFVDLNDSGNDTVFGAGFRFNINEMFSVGLSGEWGDDVSSYTLMGRANF